MVNAGGVVVVVSVLIAVVSTQSDHFEEVRCKFETFGDTAHTYYKTFGPYDVSAYVPIFFKNVPDDICNEGGRVGSTFSGLAARACSSRNPGIDFSTLVSGVTVIVRKPFAKATVSIDVYCKPVVRF